MNYALDFIPSTVSSRMYNQCNIYNMNTVEGEYGISIEIVLYLKYYYLDC